MNASLLLLTLVTAVLIGMRHATDADHVLAVSAIMAREPALGRARRIGVQWGAGHALTILCVGGLLVLSGMALPERWSLGFETCVALMLIVLGVTNLVPIRPAGGRATLPPFAIGAVHGMAGSAAASLLIVPLIHDPLWAVAYLLVFGAGTIAGMVLLTSVIALSARYASGRVQGLDRWFAPAAGAVSLCFGAVLLYRIG